MRISDWSSDVCSSDLAGLQSLHQFVQGFVLGIEFQQQFQGAAARQSELMRFIGAHSIAHHLRHASGNASCFVIAGIAVDQIILDASTRDRKRVVEGKRVSVRVSSGGRRLLTNKTYKKTLDS